MLHVSESVTCSVVSDSLSPHRLLLARLLCPLDSPGKTTGVGSHYVYQGIFPIQGSNPRLRHCRWSPALQADSLPSEPPGKPHYVNHISVGTSPVVQWLRLRAPNEGDPGSIPGQRTRSHMPRPSVPMSRLRPAKTNK